MLKVASNVASQGSFMVSEMPANVLYMGCG